MVNMNLNQYWQILWGRRRIVYAVTGIIVGITIFLVAIMPTTYTASTSINFEFGGGNPYADVRAGSPSVEGSYISTQINIIHSLNVAQRVVDSLSPIEKEQLIRALEANHTIVDTFIGSIKSIFNSVISFFGDEGQSGDSIKGSNEAETPKITWMARAIAGAINVTPITGSRILTLSYTSTDPSIAALITNKYVQAYTKTNLEMMIDPARNTAAWFDERLKSMRQSVEASQAKLAAYQQAEGIVATDEKFDIENTRLSELTSQLLAMQAETRKARTLQHRIQELKTGGSALDNIPEIQSNPSVQKIKDELRNLEAKLAELSSRLGQNHPQYQRVLEEISAAKSRLNREFAAIVEGANNSVRIAEERERAAEAALTEQKTLVLQLKNQRGTLDVLTREVESAREAYNAALAQFNQSSLQSLVTQTNVNIIDIAQIPRSPSGPNIGQNIVLALIVGLMLGVGLAFVIELLDRRIRAKEDLITELGLPVLGTLERI